MSIRSIREDQEEEGSNNERGSKKNSRGDKGKEAASWGDRKVDRLEPTKGTEKGEDEQESESDPE